ncbi:FxSxx-COOH system tetratricopeptide repeat protein, partial [Lentzea sp. NPDC054927]
MADQWDFFVSYTATDRAWAEWVAWELEEAGHQVLIQAWDMVPGSNWVNLMHQGVQNAERTIALLSLTYLSSVYGTSEWQAAWGDDPLAEKRKLLVFRVEECERRGLLKSVVSQDLFGVPEGVVRQRLHEGVRAAQTGRVKPSVPPEFPGRTRAVVTEPRFPGALPTMWNVPARNPNFIGRDESLTSLRDVVRSSGTVAVHSLRGMGGVGKSQLAIEYAHRFASDFDLVWWIPSEQPALIPDHLAKLGAVLGIAGQSDLVSMVSAVHTALRSQRRWLLIFDNAEAPETLREYLPSGAGQVLITTRRAGFGALSAELDVDVLDRAESIALLTRRLPAIVEDQAWELAEALSDLPLALEQASAYMNTNGLPVATYLTMLRTRTIEMIGRGRVVGRDQTLATLWDMSLTELGRHHPAALQLLDLLAHLAPAPVPLDLFTTNSHDLPTPLADIVTDPIAFTDAVGALADHFLIRRTTNEMTIVHRLLQQSLRARHSASRPWESAEHPNTAVQELLAADLPDEIETMPSNWFRWRTLLPHVLAVCEDLRASSANAIGSSAWLLDHAATYLRVHSQPADAKPLYERALAINEAVYGPDHPSVAINLNSLGNALQDLGQPADAVPLLERALAINEAVYGPNHPSVATNLNSLGNALAVLGQPADAVPLLERALAINEAVYGPDHPSVAINLNDLGNALQDLGQPADAVPLLKRALAIDEAAYGPNHHEVASNLNDLGNVLCDLDQPEDARPLYERALAIDEATYGPNHYEVATNLNNLGNALHALGQPEDARPLYERALAIDEATYGPNHPNVAFNLIGLGGVLHDLGQPEDAVPLLERAVAVDEAAYGLNHPKVASDLAALAAVRVALGQFEEARLLYERALVINEAAYGSNHPDVAINLV